MGCPAALYYLARCCTQLALCISSPHVSIRTFARLREHGIVSEPRNACLDRWEWNRMGASCPGSQESLGKVCAWITSYVLTLR